MNDGTDRVPRLVVGISRSPASWWALAWAVGEARRRQATLLLVNVFRTPAAACAADYSPGFGGTPLDPHAAHVACGNALVETALQQVLGRVPGDVRVEQEVVCGQVAATLAGLAWGDDLLVLGCRRRGRLGRHAPGSVARACARLADCPVEIVPEPLPSEIAAFAASDPGRSHRFRWMSHRGARAAS